MDKIIKIDNFVLCAICHKRQATILCDFPTGRVKNFHMRNSDGTTDFENSFKEYTTTCDNPVCSKCAVEIKPGIHFCKKCYEKLKE